MAHYLNPHQTGRQRGRGFGRGRGRGYNQSYQSKNDGGFRIAHPCTYQGASPLMGQPRVLGTYSVDSDRDFGHDRSMLKYIAKKYLPEDEKPMKVNMDLNRGFEKVKLYTGNPEEAFHNFLRWILSNQEQLTAEGSTSRLDTDFVSLRGVFSKIMCAPYAGVEAWTFLAKFFKGTVYITACKRQEEEEEEKKEKEEEPPEPPPPGTVYGHKFEHYMTGGNVDGDLHCNEEFRCVLKLELENLSLLYAPEVDCADPDLYEEDFTDLSGFVLVKSSMEITQPHKKKNYRKYKLNRYWVENRLSGTARVVVGFRNEEGIVNTLQMYHTASIPELAQGEWQPSVSINFLAQFLAYVKKKVMAEPSRLHRFEREAYGDVRHSLEPAHKNILPSWYTEELFTKEEE